AAGIADAHAGRILNAMARCGRRMDANARPLLLLAGGRCLAERAVEKVAGRRTDELEWKHLGRTLIVGAVVDDRRHARMLGADALPVRLEAKPTLRLGKAIEEVRLLERRRPVDPSGLVDLVDPRKPGAPQPVVEQFVGRHVEARMLRTEALRERA